jgi:hypothetical protein
MKHFVSISTACLLSLSALGGCEVPGQSLIPSEDAAPDGGAETANKSARMFGYSSWNLPESRYSTVAMDIGSSNTVYSWYQAPGWNISGDMVGGTATDPVASFNAASWYVASDRGRLLAVAMGGSANAWAYWNNGGTLQMTRGTATNLDSQAPYGPSQTIIPPQGPNGPAFAATDLIDVAYSPQSSLMYYYWQQPGGVVYRTIGSAISPASSSGATLVSVRIGEGIMGIAMNGSGTVYTWYNSLVNVYGSGSANLAY